MKLALHRYWITSEVLHKTNTFSSDKSHISKIGNYIDQTALNHLKSQFLAEIKNELSTNNANIVKNGIQNAQNKNHDLIKELGLHIQNLQSSPLKSKT